MSAPDIPRRRTAEQAFPRLLALPAFVQNQGHDEGQRHISETAPVKIILNGSPTFHIAPSLLSSSHYFSTILSSQPEPQEIFVFGITVDIFRTYISFICDTALPIPFADEDDQPGQNAFWNHWAACYSLGYRLRDTPFRNALIDTAVRRMILHDSQPNLLVETVYANSTEGSEHRCLVRDLALHTWRIWEIMAVRQGEFKDDLFRDLVCAVRQEGVERMGVGEFLERKVGAYLEG